MNRLSRSNAWRRWWKWTLGLSLGLAVSSASAGEVEWHAASGARPPSDPPTGPPSVRVIASTEPAVPSSAAGPAVTLLAPVPLPTTPAARPDAAESLKPVSFSGVEAPESRVIFRAQMSEAPTAPKAMPVGLPDVPADLPSPPPVDGVLMPPLLPGPAGTCLNCQPCPCEAPAGGDADGSGRFGLTDDSDAPNHRLWVSAEYLMWWIKGQRLPPLVTTGSPNDPVPGALGQPNTVLLYGNGHVSEDVRSGLRFRAGWWFDDEHTIGLDGSFFYLAQRSVNFNAGSNGSPPLFRPYMNTGFPAGQGLPTQPFEDTEIVAFPGVAAGGITVNQTSRLWGYEANLRTNIFNGSYNEFCYTIDGYVGFRSLGLDESLQITEGITSLLPLQPGTLLVQDRFATQNRFYGAQFGIDSEVRFGRAFLDLNARLAAGNVHEIVNIQGATITGGPTGVAFSQGGLLAQASNIGHFDRDHFAVLPEVGLTLGYQLTDYLRVFVGYNVLYLSSVARPAQEIDRVVNPTFIPGSPFPQSGPARPSFTFHQTDFYAQGANFGLEFRW